MNTFAKLKSFIEENDNFVLVGHKNADGDCIGTMSAFAVVLEKLNKSFELLVADPVPYGYGFLKYVKDFKVVSEYRCKGRPLILFECGTVARCGITLKDYGKTVNLMLKRLQLAKWQLFFLKIFLMI